MAEQARELGVPVRELFGRLLAHGVLPVSALTCQVISNVPAAILLSQFTDRFRELLIGANIGTTCTVLIGAIGGIPAKKQTAASSLVFNTATALAVVPLLPLFFHPLAWHERRRLDSLAEDAGDAAAADLLGRGGNRAALNHTDEDL